MSNENQTNKNPRSSKPICPRTKSEFNVITHANNTATENPIVSAGPSGMCALNMSHVTKTSGTDNHHFVPRNSPKHPGAAASEPTEAD